MPDLRENCMALLSRTVIADIEADAPTLNLLYTCPPGKKCIIEAVIAHSNTASMAGATDMDFGGGAAAATPVFLDAFAGFADMTAVDDYYVLRPAAGEYIMLQGDDATAANRTFGVLVTAGATAAGGISMDVFGILV